MQTRRHSWLTAIRPTLLLLTAALGLLGCNAGNPSAQSAAASSPPAPDYQTARYDPIHFKPAIDKATNAQCLACHQEVLKPSVARQSPAGVPAAEAKAWYQQTSTYQGDQDTLHRRHLETPLAKQLMTMRCSTCHQGNDPRDEAPGTSATNQKDQLTLRKMVDPEAVCLSCHGKLNWQVMGLPEPWEQSKAVFQNNCTTCHAAIRTTRHQVNYLNARAIEDAGARNGDICFGCHGGRAWYRTHFPYPRHTWPGMPAEMPDWAKGRPTASDVRFLAETLNQGTKP